MIRSQLRSDTFAAAASINRIICVRHFASRICCSPPQLIFGAPASGPISDLNLTFGAH